MERGSGHRNQLYMVTFSCTLQCNLRTKITLKPETIQHRFISTLTINTLFDINPENMENFK